MRRCSPGLQPWVAAVTAQFEEAMAEGSLRADLDARAMAELVIGSFSGLAALTGQLGDDRLDERVDALVAMVRAYSEPHALRPRTAARTRAVTGKGRTS